MRGSTFLAVAAVGAISETILGIAIPDLYALRFKRKLTVAEAVDAWTPVLAAVLALHLHS